MIFRLTFILCVFTVCCINGFRVFQVDGVETILALEKEDLKIQCRADSPMAYCGFIDPNGKRYSFSEPSLDAGQCSYKTKASISDSGEWRCHIGRKNAIGLEIMQVFNVRVVNHLAAIKKNINTVHGKKVTISCATVQGLTPIKYCRFEPPTGKPFNIRSDVTPEFPILDRYYFPSNKSLDRGDCAVTIRKVKYEDNGLWTCGAGYEDGKEHIDTIILEVEGLYTMSTASATGITFGAIGVVAFLTVLGFIVWRKRRFLGSVPEVGEPHELRVFPVATPQRSREGSPRSLARSQGSIDEPIRRIPLHGSQPPTPRGSPALMARVPRISVQSPSEAGSPLSQ